MEFLKKHYEKIILSVVLLGLAVVAAYLPIQVNQEKEKEQARKDQLINPRIEPLKPVDLSTNEAVLVKVKTPIHFDIAGRHNLFNPVPWVQKPNGELLKVKLGTEVGISALEVTAINPLQMIINYEAVLGQGAEAKYQITVIKETEKSPKNSRAFTIGIPNNLGVLKEIKGPPEAPTELVFIPAGENEPVVFSKDKPFSKVIGYAADIRYPVGNWMRKNIRKGDVIPIGNDQYIVFAIDEEKVIFSNKANKTRTTIPLTNKPKEPAKPK
jgi:hypothetical protein